MSRQPGRETVASEEQQSRETAAKVSFSILCILLALSGHGVSYIRRALLSQQHLPERLLSEEFNLN